MGDDLPTISRYKPYYAELEKGKQYFWCACGLSKTQPYCDGSHKGTSFRPVVYRGQHTGEEVLFCGCKHSNSQPLCDGSHNNLRDEYDVEDPKSEKNKAVVELPVQTQGITELDGGCFVASLSALEYRTEGDLRWTTVIDQSAGAVYQGFYHFEVIGDDSPYLSFGETQVILFCAVGPCVIEISGKGFALDSNQGALVKEGESFRLMTAAKSASIYAGICPLTEGPKFADTYDHPFCDQFQDRVVGIDPSQQSAMGDRFFQILVGKDQGCTTATQFIGNIPQSKATPHRHLYEESLVIVSGEGCMWTDNVKTKVRAGDVIFLPRKRSHSLEATHADGLVVAGVIYPGDNPSINY